MARDSASFDGAAAVTRSLLGWGVVAGPFYVVVGLVLALTRADFDLTRHALSLLMLGEHGWMQRLNLVLSAVMVLAAALGILRAIPSGRGLAIGAFTAVYGVCLMLSAAFLPDPTSGFPAGQASGAASTSGILHLVFGAVGFLSLVVAAGAYAKWAAGRGDTRHARTALWCGVLVLAGFIGGAALAQNAIGILLLWLAVLAGWAWLALASAHLYTVVPHPVIAERRDLREAGH